MYALSVILEIDPAHVEEFKEAALRHARNTKNNEPGCLEFAVFQHEEQPERFYFHECYQNKAAVEDVHKKAPYLAEFGEKTKGWIRGKTIACWNGA